jgi:hypothetical protein
MNNIYETKPGILDFKEDAQRLEDNGTFVQSLPDRWEDRHNGQETLAFGTSRWNPSGNPMKWPQRYLEATPRFPGKMLNLVFEIWASPQGQPSSLPVLVAQTVLSWYGLVEHWLSRPGYGGWQTFEQAIYLPPSQASCYTLHFYIWRRDPAWGSGWRFGGVKVQQTSVTCAE